MLSPLLHVVVLLALPLHVEGATDEAVLSLLMDSPDTPLTSALNSLAALAARAPDGANIV